MIDLPKTPFYLGNIPLYVVLFKLPQHAFLLKNTNSENFPIALLLNGKPVRVSYSFDLSYKGNSFETMEYVGVIDRVYYENPSKAQLVATAYNGIVKATDFTIQDILDENHILVHSS
jgi:hypothetical protein